jgi:hypothetical protein
VSSRYSVALTMNTSEFDVQIFIVEVREPEDLKDEKDENKVMANIVGKQRIIFGAPRKITTLILFPYFELHWHEDHQVFDIVGVRLIA